MVFGGEMETCALMCQPIINLLAPDFFLILAHPVYKM